MLDTRGGAVMKSFPHRDPYWQACLSFLIGHVRENDVVLAPPEFVQALPCHVDAYSSGSTQHPHWIVIHKGMIPEIWSGHLTKMVRRYTPVFANEVFVVFSTRADLPCYDRRSPHIKSLWERISLRNRIMYRVSRFARLLGALAVK
jgi:hypothetical protein